MVINNPAYKKAIQSLWDGRATVTVRVGRLNEATGRTEPVEQVTVKDAACRLSHKTVTTTEPTEFQQRWSNEQWFLQYDLMFGKGYALKRMGLAGLSGVDTGK